jgi:hypothetical protein
MRSLPAILLSFLAPALFGQATGLLRGTVRDEAGVTLPMANVTVVGLQRGVVCDERGEYRMELPAGKPLKVRWSFTGTQAYEEEVVLNAGEERVLNVRLKFTTLGVVDVEGRRMEREQGVEKIDPRLSKFNPSPLQGVEALLIGQMGVVARNELSAGGRPAVDELGQSVGEPGVRVDVVQFTGLDERSDDRPVHTTHAMPRTKPAYRKHVRSIMIAPESARAKKEGGR